MSGNKKKYPWNKGNKKDPGGMTEVYAGPMPIPDEPEEDDPRMMEGVYAGPPAMEPQMKCVYAGPEFFSGNRGRAPDIFVPEAVNAKYCAVCGALLKKEYRFCPSCGAPIPRESE